MRLEKGIAAFAAEGIEVILEGLGFVEFVLENLLIRDTYRE